MIKNIILTLAIVVAVFFVVYAKIKAVEAEKQAIIAEVNLREAGRQQEIAMSKTAEVRKLQRELEECAK